MADLPPPPGASAPLSQWAGWLADVCRATRAFRVFPCRPDDGRRDKAGKLTCKQPLRRGWQEAASWDRAEVEARWSGHPGANIGLAVQPGFVALDADVYKPGNEALLAEFEAEYGELPRTLEFHSANGGFHLIYSSARDLGNAIGALPRFGDVRGHGGYIVGPGSTAEGKPYTVARLADPVPLPPHVDARLAGRRAASDGERGAKPGVLIDDPVNQALYTVWLLTEAEPSVEGRRGNDTLAATGAMGSSYGLSQDVALELMERHWNPRCGPPWEPDALEYHGGSGYRSASSKFGNKARPNASALGFVPQAGAPPPGGRSLVRSMADIAGPPPAREWAIGDDADGWAPLGELTFLYGPGGIGKTALTGQVCLALARGEPLFGVLPVRRMPAFLVACEDSEDELHRRFAAQGRRATDAVEFVALVGRDAALHPPFRQAGGEDTWLYSLIDHHLAAMPAGPKLLVLDNLAQVYMGNYYEPSEITRFLNAYLRGLAMRHGATVIVLAHPSEGQRASGDGGYGGVQWSNGVRSRLYFEAHMTEPLKKGDKPRPIGRQRVLSRKKGNYSDGSGGRLVLDWDDWKFKVAEPPARPAIRLGFRPVAPLAEAEDAIVQRAVEQVLAGRLADFSTRQLALDTAHLLGEQEHAGLGHAAVRSRHLPRMIAAGHPAYRRDEGKGLWRHAGKE